MSPAPGPGLAALGGLRPVHGFAFARLPARGAIITEKLST
jgi:hypothetical protein